MKKPEFNESISFQQLRSNIEFLNMHIQLIDSSLVKTIRTLRSEKKKDETLDINLALKVDKDKYDKLNHPLKQYPSIIKFTQYKNIEFSIILTYNIFSDYLRSIVSEMFESNPLFIVNKAVVEKNGEDKDDLTLKYAEIVKLGTYELITEKIVTNIFRGFEEQKSTKKLLEKVLKDTKTNISNSKIEEALKYLELRHLIIHNKSKIDAAYAKKYGKKFNPNLKEGNKIPRKFEVFKSCIKAVFDLCNEIDSELIKTGFIEKRKFNGNTTPNILYST